MKQLYFVLSFLLLLPTGCNKDDDFDGDYYYTANGEKIFLETKKDWVLAYSETPEPENKFTAEGVPAFNLEYGYYKIMIDPSQTSLEDIKQLEIVEDAIYWFTYKGAPTVHTHMLFIRCAEGETLEDTLADYLNLVKEYELSQEEYNTYLVTFNVPLNKMLELCRDIYEKTTCIHAVPNSYNFFLL